jgi:peptidyl-prolyl cis-trans isomerase SurA
MILFGNNKFYTLTFVFIFLLSTKVIALENKIVLKVNNEIITTIDVEKEINYLKAFNNNIKKLDSDEIFLIAKKNLLKEKIRQNEILKYVEEIKIDEKYYDKYIASTYKKMGFKSQNDFLLYINRNNLHIDNIKKKISIQYLWNQLIFSKFSNKINIDKEKLKEKIISRKNQEIKSFFLSEILFDISQNENLQTKYEEIKKNINENGFENTALIYSLSDTKNDNGELGWIKENILNDKIFNILNNTNIGEITKPITVPGGFLILRVEEIKSEEMKLNIESELKTLIKLETNKQLEQRSNIYFNKIKKNNIINEL